MVVSPAITNPFPGLRPFDLDEEHLFFGREGQADELLERLNQTGFLAVVGSSGSGKSSLVRAGLLPSLYSGFLNEASSHWRVALMRPGNAPIRNLAEALNEPDVFGQALEDEDRDLYIELTETTLRRGDLGLVEVVKQARMAVRESLLLVIDQFEELFRFKRMADTVAADDEAAAFVKLFLTAVQQEAVPIYVVLTMRSDFLGDCAQFRGLPEAINDSQYLIPRMTRDQRRSAVEGPVAVGEATITPRLVNRVLNDMGDDPDQLPILQHAMMRTWRRWSKDHTPGEPLDLRHYEAIGGMTQSLSQHADEIYGTLDERAQTVAEKLFKCLTEKGPDNREIRRPTSLAEVCAVAEATPEEVIQVVEVFRATGCSFLVPPVGVELSETSVLDISHESFMRVWRRLKDWVDDEAQSSQIYRRLAETAVLYEAGQAGYLQNPELTIGLTWRQLAQPNEIWAGRYAPTFEQTMRFLEASATNEQTRRRKSQALYGFIGTLIVLSGVALGAAGYASFQRGEALKQTQIAEQRGNELEIALNDTEEARKDEEEAKLEALEQTRIAEEARKDEEEAKLEALKQTEIAEQAQNAEVEQRQLAETALVRAEEGEAEAQRQADIAREQTLIAEENAVQAQSATARAEQEKQRAEILALNSDIQAEALTVESLISSNIHLKAMLAALNLVQTINQWEQQAVNSQIAATVKAQDKSQQDKKISAVHTLYSPILPSRQLQALSVLREVYYLPGYLERNTLRGHSNEVWSVSFSPDGQTLASASRDGTVKLWDRSGRELQTLEGHSNVVWSVSFSPDGQTLASASRDGTVKLWDRSGRELQTLQGHFNEVNSISFSPDGQTLASASSDGTIKLWDRSGRELQTLQGHSNVVWSVSFSPDGQTLASASSDGTVKLWDRSGRELQTLQGHSNAVLSVSFSPDGQTLASASRDSTIKLWDRSGRELQTLEGHSNAVFSVRFSPDGQTLASTSRDGTVKLWDRNGRELQTLQGHSNTIGSVSFSPDGQVLASASADRTVKVWKRSGRELQTLEGHSDTVNNVRFSPDGQTLASASSDGTIKLWDRSSGQELQTLEGHSDTVNNVRFSPDGQTLASASSDGTIKLWDRNGRELQTLQGHFNAINNARFSPDGQVLASASSDGTIKLWDRSSGRELQTLEGHSNVVWSVSFSPDGQVLASASSDGTIKLWDRNGRELQTLEGYSNVVLSVSFAPDGQVLASASSDGTIKLWDRSSGQELQTLEGHSNAVSSVSFSPDGQVLASASSDGTVKLWDRNGRELQTLQGHSDTVNSVSFSSDGQALASASRDGTIKLWNFSQTDLIVRSCSWLNDYLVNHPQDLTTLKICQTPSLLASAAPVLVAEALQIARRGRFDEAMAGLQTAQTWNNSVDLDPETDRIESSPKIVVAQRVALHRLAIGERLAAQGDVEGAIIAYQEALTLDPTIDLDPSTEEIRETDPVLIAQRLSIPSKVKRGERLIREGNLDEAISAYREALALDPNFDLDPSTEDIQETDPILLVAIGFLNRGKELAQSGEIEAAILAYRQSQELGADITDKDWSLVCWSGIRFNVPSQVLFACDNATTLASDSLWGQQSRSVARALVDDVAGAAQDLQAVVSWLDSSQAPFLPEEFKSIRKNWLSALQDLQNPFTPEAIEQVPAITLQSGDAQITLEWTAAADIDISVVDPDGNKVYYENLSVPSGGHLERDITCSNPMTTNTQVENIFWPTNRLPIGEYTAEVAFSGICEGEDATDVDFSLNVLIQGQSQMFSGAVSEENPAVNFEFSVPPNR